MDKKRLAEIRRIAQGIDASVYIGKDGLTEGIRKEVEKQLKTHKFVKVRLLASCETDRHDSAEDLARATGAHLVEVRGRTVVLARE